MRLSQLNVKQHRYCVLIALFAVIVLLPTTALAYIGPGAGFALISSAFVFVLIFFSVLFSILFWPVRALLSWWRGRRARKKARIKRLVILGLDGLDPNIAEQLMKEGKLPHFSKLAKQGKFSPLATSCPPISPVAWSCFMTGCNPGRHNIYDFLARDPRSYLPVLSSTKIGEVERTIRLGKYEIPLGKPTIRLLRKSQPFWSILGKQGIASTVLRVPITFPPEKTNGQLLSGMCVPDLRGTQGTFTLYTTEAEGDNTTTGGTVIPLTQNGNLLRGELLGPMNPLTHAHEMLKIPFEAQVIQHKWVSLSVGGETLKLEPGKYSPWIQLKFDAGLRTRVQGIARFLVTEIQPALKLYVSPINIDPEKPVLPISFPFSYAIYLAKRFSPYATLGLAEDTWALNEHAIGDQAFLDQAYLNHGEREKMFFDALAKRKRGLVACVFDTTDRVQHTFWRYRNPQHPALVGKDRDTFADAIEQLYTRMDSLVGQTLAKLGPQDALMVMSDHGFNDFSRGFNINTWLYQNGYLKLKPDTDGSKEWFGDVDWKNSRAYSLGMTCIYLNLKGREAQGIVKPGAEEETLKQEIAEKLASVRDKQNPEQKPILHVRDRRDIYRGPYVRNAPDLTLGFNVGYRASWASVQGKLRPELFVDNQKAWSGDHCLAPEVVPGVLFTSFAHDSDQPKITDVAPSALKLLGADVPGYMEGAPLQAIKL